MKHLVIAEKPSVGRDIARVLHCNKKTNTYIEGTDYIVTWALGHLVTLADPEQYDEQYKTWNMDTLPMLPEHWKLVVIKQTGRQFHAVKELIFRKDVSDIIIATDAGREGELVARWILDKAGNQKPLKRLWISSVTDKAIREGFQNLRPGKSYEPLYRAAVARAQSDWVVGINATRALTCKYNAQLSAGRVQMRLKLLKIQKEIFISEEKELTRAEYGRLVRKAEKKGKERLSLLIQTICSTGIRVSELEFITVAAVKRGRAEVNCKGKRRVIFLPVRLQKKLKAYAAKKGITEGVIFASKSGRPLHRGNIWAEMKKLCKDAEVSPEKVFPHNLRHLFARIFYSLDKDIAKLADMLGHSHIETTRIYIMESGRIHRQKLERMRLVL